MGESWYFVPELARITTDFRKLTLNFHSWESMLIIFIRAPHSWKLGNWSHSWKLIANLSQSFDFCKRRSEESYLFPHSLDDFLKLGTEKFVDFGTKFDEKPASAISLNVVLIKCCKGVHWRSSVIIELRPSSYALLFRVTPPYDVITDVIEKGRNSKRNSFLFSPSYAHGA